MNCGHAGCGCRVEQAGDFCSEHCREHAGQSDHGDHACECGHAECGSGAGADRTTEDDIQAAFD